MRVLIDATAAGVGGLGTYVRNLVPAWSTAFPHDSLFVLASDELDAEFGPEVRVATVRTRPAGTLLRPLRQSVAIRRAIGQFGPEVLLATMPSMGLAIGGLPSCVVLHDFRHEILKHQFSRPRRILRAASYGLAYRQADSFICISERTRKDLRALHPRLASTPSSVVHHGSDHIRRRNQAAQADQRHAIAFGHHSNKNPRMVIEAWALGRELGARLPRLLVVGTPKAELAAMRSLVHDLDLDTHVEVAEYLDERAFHDAFENAAVVVFPSDFEGFGLPVLEAMRLEIPVVISPDPALQEVGAGHAHSMNRWTSESVLSATVSALASTADDLAIARSHAEGFSWARTASQTRQVLQSTLARHDHSRDG